MNNGIINYVMRRMADYLDNSQMIKLQLILEEAFKSEEKALEKSSAELLEQFLSIKRLEGRSEKTLAV